MTLQFDAQTGRLGLASLTAHGKSWSARVLRPILRVEGVRVAENPPATVDGSEGLRLESRTESSLTCVHEQTGLRLTLSFAAAAGGGIVHRLALGNARADQLPIEVAFAATLALPVDSGDWVETLGADDAPGQWTRLQEPVPLQLGYEGLRNGSGGAYPLATLTGVDGHGITIAVDTATAWRIDVHADDAGRSVVAGEFASNVAIRPLDVVELPDVLTLFHGPEVDGFRASLHAYLAATSARTPRGWPASSPTLFNTWFAFGTDLSDDGSFESPLRTLARQVADLGIEVLVIDAGWYAGNPRPRRAPDDNEVWADDFTSGLGTWVEAPDKWQARPGDGGTEYGGLRNFSDYVHSLEVRVPDGSAPARLKLGLWFEPERCDSELDSVAAVPAEWLIPYTPIVNFSKTDIVDALFTRVQNAITRYHVDYVKIDANADLHSDESSGREGHFWTQYSKGFERFLLRLAEANPDVYIEHCAAGLRRFWIGMPRLANSTWLDDHIGAENVAALLDATDDLLLPRQKTVLVKEDVQAESPRAIGDILRTYWGDEHRNGGALGLSSRIDRLTTAQTRAIAEALDFWKTTVRDDG